MEEVVAPIFLPDATIEGEIKVGKTSMEEAAVADVENVNPYLDFAKRNKNEG